MNAEDRKAIEEIKNDLQSQLNKKEALESDLEEVKGAVMTLGGRIRDIADAEQEKYDNLSEGLQQAEMGQSIEEAASVLSSAADSAEDDDIQSTLDELANLE